jgi:hypothetical protein
MSTLGQHLSAEQKTPVMKRLDLCNCVAGRCASLDVGTSAPCLSKTS